MKTMKKALALLICFVMVVSMFPGTAFAADGNTNVAISVSATEVNVGDTFTVTVSCSDMYLSSLTAGIKFDKSLLEVVSIVGCDPKYPEDFGLYMVGKRGTTWVYATAASSVEDATKNGTVGFGYAGTADANFLGGNLFTVTFKALTAGSAKFVLYEDSAGTDGYANDNISTTIVTIKEAAPACEHTNTTTATTVEATCTTKGTKTTTCDDCGEVTGTEEIPATGHVNTKTTTVDATCEVAGSVTVKCDDCGATVSTTAVPATGHVNTKTTTVDATCEVAGSVTVKCEDCGKTISTEVLPVVDHTAGEPVVTTTPATCTEEGKVVTETFCTECEKSLSYSEESIEATGHSWGAPSYNWSAGNSACTATRVCEKGCKETAEATVTFKGSCADEGGKIVYTATFTADWAETQTQEVDAAHEYFYECDAHCMICGELTNPDAKHNVTHVDANPGANCQEWGTAEYWACETCGGMWLDEALTQVTNKMSVNVPGPHEYFYPCDPVCMHCYEVTNSDAEHDIKHYDAVPAENCQELGTVEYWTCNSCGGAWLDAELTRVTNKMSLNVPGPHEYFYECDAHCMHCGELTNPDAGHNITYVAAAPAANCQEWGTVEYWACETCGGIWLDAALTQLTNRFGINAPGPHEYFYECDAHCMHCGELTNPDAEHVITHVDANPGANCQEWGTVEFWACEICGGMWLDEALTQVTNRFGINAPGPHVDATYTDNGDGTHTGKCDLCGETVDEAAEHEYESYVCVCGAKFTGWDGKTYIKDAVLQKTGWTEIDGAWYYLDTETGIRAERLTRVPYPTAAINDITYAADADAVAYCESKGTTFIDATEAWFYFNDDGKFDQSNGYVSHGDGQGKLTNGMLAWHPGLIEVAEGVYVYFIGDAVNGGNVVANGDTWITKNNGNDAFAIGDVYNFVDGELSGAHGVVDGKYYQNSRLMMGYGLVETEKGFIYVRTSGHLATGFYYISNTANYDGDALAYGYGVTFDADGYALNGIVNGKYYVNGQVAYGAGVVEIEDGKYIYVRSNGVVVMDTTYWITAVNDTGLVAKAYEFDANGIIQNPEFVDELKNGVIDGYYYENGNIVYGAGLVEYNGGVIYVRSNGQVATGKYWVTNTNGLMAANYYTFGDDGMMIN